MTYDPNIHHRRSIRLKGYDYAQEGLYFITICCQDREHRFGTIENGKMILNDAGKIADECWLEIPKHFPNVVLHEHIIMPNHVHGIIEIANGIEGAKNNSPQRSPERNETPDIGAKNISPQQGFKSPSKTIGSIVRGFKIGVTKWFRVNPGGAKNISPEKTPDIRTKNISPQRSPDIRAKNISPQQYETTRPERSTEKISQRDYYDIIIRDERAYQNISEYIIRNPEKWEGDKFFR